MSERYVVKPASEMVEGEPCVDMYSHGPTAQLDAGLFSECGCAPLDALAWNGLVQPRNTIPATHAIVDTHDDWHRSRADEADRFRYGTVVSLAAPKPSAIPHPGDRVTIEPNQQARAGVYGVRVGRVSTAVPLDQRLALVDVPGEAKRWLVLVSDLTVIERADGPREEAR